MFQHASDAAFSTGRTNNVRAIPLFLLLLPLIEIAGFVLVGRQLGVLPTLGLVIAGCVAGSILLRIQGFGALNRIRKELEAGRDPGRELAHGATILVAGVLLLIPGFFTDIIGLLLFIPPVRDLVWRFLKSRVAFTTDFRGMRGGFSRGPGRGKTIDLDEEDFSRAPNPDSPWRKHIEGD